jgi:GAF domain-containing protein
LNIENSLSGECIKARVPLISNDIERDNRVNKEACRRIGLNSMIVMPLIYGNGVVGVLKVLSAKTGHFNDEDVKILELISELIAAAMFNAVKNDKNDCFIRLHTTD